MTLEQEDRLNSLLEALAETSCTVCTGYGGLHGEACNGTGLDSRTDMFRVTCDHWTHNSDNIQNGLDADIQWEHAHKCRATGPLTIVEAESKFHALLVEMEYAQGWDVYMFAPGIDSRFFQEDEDVHLWRFFIVRPMIHGDSNPKALKGKGAGDTPLEAILEAIAAAVELEVTVA